QALSHPADLRFEFRSADGWWAEYASALHSIWDPALLLMKRRSLLIRYLTLFVLLISASPAIAQQQEIPREWIDPDTGHRVVRLSDEPGSASLYFHQNPYTPDGKKLIITTPGGLSAIDLATHNIEKVVDGRVGVLIVGRKSGDVYYTRTL